MDPRIAEFERQIADLNAMVEGLTLDKEQLTVEQELLDDKYLQAQIELEEALAEVEALTSVNEAQAAAAAAAAGAGGGSNTASSSSADGSGGGDGAIVAALRAENDKLREALRRLNSVSVQDKQSLVTQNARVTALEAETSKLESECAALRVYKKGAEEDLHTLRATVDSVASYEDMIETLAGDNRRSDCLGCL